MLSAPRRLESNQRHSQSPPVDVRGRVSIGGAAAWGDSAMDFAGVPLRAAPSTLEVHREIVSVIDDEYAGTASSGDTCNLCCSCWRQARHLDGVNLCCDGSYAGRLAPFTNVGC
jgi:hypothetical protein